MRSEARGCRLQLLADGVAVAGVLQADVSSNNHLAADRFRVRLAAGAGGLQSVDAVGVRFEVQAGLGEGWSSLVVGEADSVTLDPIRGVIEIEGRDLSALLIDERTNETFANRTSSEIVTTLAGRHGLEVAATATGTLVGRYYQSDYDRVALGTFSKAVSEWDLLCYLAVQEGYDLFMDGAVLRFEPAGGEPPAVVGVADCLAIRLDHAMGMERSIEVTVRSWNSRGAEAVAQTAQGGGTGRAWKQSVVRPNLPPDEAQQLAERVLANLVRHTRTASLTMPGDVTLTSRDRVRLQGTGTDWDTDYVVSDIHRVLDVRHGFTQRVSLQREV